MNKDTMSNAIKLEKDGSIATITIDRPEKRNAFRHNDYDDLLDALREVDQDLSIRVCIINAAGDHFSVGDDLEGYVGGPKEHETQQHPYYGPLSAGDILSARQTGYKIPLQEMSVLCMNSGTVFIGAVQGICWAPELLYVADFVVAASDAQFGQGDVRMGICPGGGGTQTLPRLLGRRRALEILLRPTMFSAEDAYRFGLVTHIANPTELQETARQLAEEFAGLPDAGVRLTKQAVTKAQDFPLADGLQLEQEYMEVSTQAGTIWDFARDFWAAKRKR